MCSALSLGMLGDIEQRRDIRATLEGNEIRAHSDQLFAQRAFGLYAMQAFFASSQVIEAEEYDVFASRTLAVVPGLRSLNFVAPDMTIRWVMPGSERPRLQGFSLSGRIGEPIALRARANGHVAVSPSFHLHEGGFGFLMFLPLSEGGRFKGWVQGVSDTASFIELLGLPQRTERYDLELTDAQGRVLFVHGRPGKTSTVVPLRLGDQLWRLRLAPRPAGSDYWPLFLTWALGLGLCALVLNGARTSVRLAREVRARTEALETSREQLAVTLGGIADGVIAYSGEPTFGRIVYANAAAATLFGFDSVDALEGLGSSEVFTRFHFSDAAGRALTQLEMPSARALLGGTAQEQVLAFHRLPEGERRQVLSKAQPVFDASGQVRYVISILTDLTERVHLEAQLRRQLDELQALDRLKNDFLSVVTHELRTPLTSIRGFSEFLEDEIGGALTETQREYVATIQLNASQLEHLVDDLLDLARIEAGKFTLKPQALDLAGLVRQAVDSLRPAAQEKGLSLSLAAPDGALPLCGDPYRLRQVLNNLLSNAIKFTPEGGAVRVSLHAVTDGVELAIEDTGIGIAADNLPHLFAKFYQVESTLTRGYKGTGLGLAITKALVEAHQGEIAVESQEGNGTRFVVRLPEGLAGLETNDTRA